MKAKLNFACDYTLGGCKHATAVQIDGGENLVHLIEKMTMDFPAADKTVRFYRIKPTAILACSSLKEARATAEAWNEAAERNGKLYDFHSLSVNEWYKIYYEQQKLTVA